MYLYETHLHTAQGSACGKSEGHEYIKRYLDLGFTGIFVTDHFFQGNCAVDRSLPWRERVNLFCKGYEDAKNEGDKLGLDVFFGWEQRYAMDEYLIYGPQKDWLLEHPEIETATREEQLNLIHDAGGCVVQAHPFRERGYIEMIHLAPYLVDGIEGCNSGNTPEQDMLDCRYGKCLNLPMTAGSDNHRVDSKEDSQLFGVLLENKLTSAKDFARLILNHAPIGMHTNEGRGIWDEETALASVTTPITVQGHHDEATSLDYHLFLK